VILPARFPNLLVNGSSGIAVGMATNIPTHHLGEVIDGVLALSHDPEITIRDLMEYIPGPDFPTAGMIMGRSGIRRAYESGRGSITVRGRVDIEEKKNGKETIVITEIPYQVNKARLVERIAELAREKKIDGITSLNDESDRSGMRIVIEVRRDISASVIVNNLFKMTALQTTFGINMLALVDNHPKVLNLKEILYYYLEHQKVVIRRRTEFELRKAEARAHILEGLRIALDNIDAIIKLIRGSKTSDVAKEGLMTQFNLSDKQAQAILDMRLQRLTGLEREKIEEEYQNLVALINDLKAILADDERILEIIREELEEIKVKYADKRRTEILAGDLVSLEDEDLIPEEEVAITLTKRGYIKRLPLSTYRSQRRGGRGIQGMSTHEDDFVEHLVATSTHDTLLFFTNTGKVYRSKGYEVPEYGRTAKGIPIINLLGIESQEQVNAVINLSEFTDDSYLFFTTKHGVVKRTTLSQFAKIRQSGLRAVELRENDELISVQMTDGSKNMIIATKHGQSIYFPEENIRVMGRTAAGVRGIRLREDDEVIGMEVLEDDEKVLVVTEKGYGKQTPASQYPLRNRGGMGVKTVTITEKNGNLVAMKTVTGEEDLMLMTVSGVLIRFEIDTVSQTGRSAMGVKLIRLDEDEKVATVAKVPKEEDEVELEEEIDETLITQVPDESFEDAPGSDIEE
ncbi:DNA gyrase subunit A, partial [Listeria monocytogenes]